MRFHRFIVSRSLATGRMRIEDEDLLHQWGKVLRLREGDKVVIVDAEGNEATASILLLDPKAAELEVEDVRPVAAEPARKVRLCCAVLKRENFEWVVQKATEAGVSEIVPVVTARTVKTGLKQERLRSIAKEAAEQSGRGKVPRVEEPMPLRDALDRFAAAGDRFFHVGAGGGKLRLRESPEGAGAEPVTLWIGPEGGWSEDEVDEAVRRGLAEASLGELTMRAETAAVVASYLAVRGML